MTSSPRHHQAGAALVTGLVLLLILTVIGVSAMQVTRMQERMAGNSRDLNLALQGAEAALRDAEKELNAFKNPPIAGTTPGSIVFQNNVLPSVHDTNKEWWGKNGQQYGADNVEELTRANGGELDAEPQFVIEEVRFVSDNVILEPQTGRDFYQISARSTGGSGDANVVVQGTYARRFN